MCRSIKTLRNAAAPAGEAEIHEAARQYIRKISGCRQPSPANAPAFEAAVDEVAAATRRLRDSLAAAPRTP